MISQKSLPWTKGLEPLGRCFEGSDSGNRGLRGFRFFSELVEGCHAEVFAQHHIDQAEVRASLLQVVANALWCAAGFGQCPQ